MKTIRTLALSVAALTCLFASGAKAEEKFLPMYLAVSAGAYAPAGTDLDEANADPGFVGLLNFGYMFKPFIGVQTDLGYFQTTGDGDMKVSAVPVAVSLKLAIPIAFVEPYLLGGGGVYFSKATIGDFDSETSTDFGAHAAGGVNLIFGKFQVGAEGATSGSRPPTSRTWPSRASRSWGRSACGSDLRKCPRPCVGDPTALAVGSRQARGVADHAVLKRFQDILPRVA